MSANDGPNVDEIIEYVNKCIRIQYRMTEKLRKKIVLFLQYCGYTVNGHSISNIMRAFDEWQLDDLCKQGKPAYIKEKMQEYLKKQPKRGRPWGSPNRH